MAIFRRNKGQSKNQDKGDKTVSYRFEKSIAEDDQAGPSTDPKARRDDPQENSPQRVGIVSGVLSTSADSDDLSQFGAIVERRFGPNSERDSNSSGQVITNRVKDSSYEAIGAHDNLSRGLVADSPFDDDADDADDEILEFPKLEVDPMTLIGHATTITGNIVAEEDLEIQGTIEGSVRLAKHRVVVGSDGIVKATVEADSVLVIGKITGNVVATELVEVNAGGVIEGDVKAPRVIMKDGAIVIGALDMSAGSPSGVSVSTSTAASTAASASTSTSDSQWLPPVRARLMKVELPEDPLAKKDSI